MNSKRIDLVLVFVFTIITLIFFSRLFIPHFSVFITSEYGSSDIINFNLPVKVFYSNALKQGIIPLWTKDIGTGFPLLAESQMGTFYLPNLLLFRFFPSWLAFNCSYIITFLLAGIGTYFLLKQYRFSPLYRLFLSICFAYSGFFLGHIQHLNMIQAASLFPWILLVHSLYFKKSNIFLFLIYSFLLSQQIFIGHLQITFITLLTAFLILSFSKFKTKTYLAKQYIKFGLVILLALLLSSVQILPSAELANLSIRSSGFSTIETIFFSFTWVDFAGLLNPFINGKVSNATYSYLNGYDGRLFWENVIYIGIVPFLLLISSFFHKSKQKKIIVYRLLLLLSILLILGKYSPIYVLFSFFPFSYFRVPARFLLLFVFSSVIIIGYQLQSAEVFLLKKCKGSIILSFKVFLIITLTADIFINWFLYNPTYPINKWFELPETARYIMQQNKQIRYTNIQEKSLWFGYSIKNGWVNKEPYFYFRNDLVPNQNLIWHLPNYLAWVGVLWTKRYIILKDLFSNTITTEPNTDVILLNDTAIKLFSLNSVGYIVTPFQINSSSLHLVYETSSNIDELPSYKIYSNINVLPRAHFVHSYTVITTYNDMKKYVLSSYFDPSKEVILESHLGNELSNISVEQNKNIEWIKDADEEIVLKTNTTDDNILVLSDTYYPGWIAYVDGVETSIMPANINQRAIIVPKGEHIIRFLYKPKSFFIGVIISALFYIPLLIVAIYFLVRRTFYKVRRI